MAGGAGLADFQEDGVLVAVDADLDDVLLVAGRVALAPEAFARARPVDGAAGVDGELKRFGIHPGEHEDFAGVGILRDGGDEAVSVEFRAQLDGFVLGGAGEGRGVGHGASYAVAVGTGSRCGWKLS